ncbi:hypothetical protein J2T18_001747 [Paenibacillus polymyxa]|nr:hypothetical protein [Paenibacillus polymyxa]
MSLQEVLERLAIHLPDDTVEAESWQPVRHFQ